MTKPDPEVTAAMVKFARDKHVSEQHAREFMLYDLALRVERLKDAPLITEGQALQVLTRVESLRSADQGRRAENLRFSQEQTP